MTNTNKQVLKLKKSIVIDDTEAIMQVAGSDMLNLSGIECPYCKGDVDLSDILLKIQNRAKLQTWKLAKQDELSKLEDDVRDIRQIFDYHEAEFGDKFVSGGCKECIWLQEKLAQKQQERDDIIKLLKEIE